MKKPRKKYRLLEDGEVIKDGDQYKSAYNDRWEDIKNLPGHWTFGIKGGKFDTCRMTPYRRAQEDAPSLNISDRSEKEKE